MTNKTTDTSAATAQPLSQYQIDPKVAVPCLAKVRALYADLNFETIIDPSAGQGAVFGQLGSDCIARDRAPTRPGIATADFLEWTPATPAGAAWSSAPRPSPRARRWRFSTTRRNLPT